MLLAQAITEDAVLNVDVQALNLLAGLVVPLLVGLLAKWNASRGLKAVLNFFLSALAGGLAIAIAAEGQIIIEEWISGIGMTWLISVASYYGLWKPTNVAPAIGQKTAGFGIG